MEKKTGGLNSILINICVSKATKEKFFRIVSRMEWQQSKSLFNLQ